MKIALWVRTAEAAAFPFTKMPAYTVIPMLPCLVYARPWTLILAVVCTLATWYMARKGYTLFWLYNRLRGLLCGNRLSARPAWVIRRFCFLHDPAGPNGK